MEHVSKTSAHQDTTVVPVQKIQRLAQLAISVVVWALGPHLSVSFALQDFSAQTLRQEFCALRELYVLSNRQIKTRSQRLVISLWQAFQLKLSASQEPSRLLLERLFRHAPHAQLARNAPRLVWH